jgi:hypothetical protein
MSSAATSITLGEGGGGGEAGREEKGEREERRERCGGVCVRLCRAAIHGQEGV